MSQKQRPVLLTPELDPAQPLPPPSRSALDEGRFRVAEALERPEAMREAMASGRIRALNPETAGGVLGGREQPPAVSVAPAPSPAPAPVAPVSSRTDEEVSLSTKVPLYVLKQLRRRYAESGVTIRNQILLALRCDGFQVEDADITDERKRPRR